MLMVFVMPKIRTPYPMSVAPNGERRVFVESAAELSFVTCL